MVELLLQKARKLIDRGLNSENREKKRKNFLKAAEKLYKAAEESNGEVKKVRINNADKLVKRAKRLESKAESLKEKTSEQKLESKAVLQQKPNVEFEDIGGLNDVKEEIKSKIVYPFLYPNKAEKYGVSSGGGILLYGPPGTGKTMLAKATAREVNAEFFSLDPENIMSRWVGDSEKKIGALFEKAREEDRSIMFIDEVESLLPKRRSTDSSVMKRVVPKFLEEMEGIKSANEDVLIIGATNEPWELDHAAMRPGRFDEKILVHLPDIEAREKIFRLNLNVEAVQEDEIDYGTLAEETTGYSGADVVHVCETAKKNAWLDSIEKDEDVKIDMENILNSIKGITPSISKSSLEKYKEFKEDFTK